MKIITKCFSLLLVFLLSVSPSIALGEGILDGFVFDDGYTIESDMSNVKPAEPEEETGEKSVYTINGLEGFIFEGEKPVDTVLKSGEIGASYIEAYTLLKALEIITEDDGTNMDAPFTRRQLSRVAVILSRLDDSVNKTIPFSDMKADDPDYGAMAAAYLSGTVSGASSDYFIPDGNVSVAEVCRVLVNALGYGTIAAEKGGYPNGYMNEAINRGVFKGISVSSNKSATLGNAILMIFNSLNVKVADIKSISAEGVSFEQNELTLLEMLYKVRRIRGVFNEMYGSNIYGASYCAEGKIGVDRVYYNDFNQCVSPQWFGRRIILYAIFPDGDGDKEVIAALEDSLYETIKVSEHDIERIESNGRLICRVDEKEKKVSISQEALVMRNGEFSGNLSTLNLADILPLSGDVTFIDHDGDDNADVLQIWDYRYAVVESVSQSLGRILFKNGMLYNGLPYFEIDTDNTVMTGSIISEEKALDISDIMPGDVISLAVGAGSFDLKPYRIYVSSKTITGTLLEVNVTDDKTLVDTLEYQLAYGYEGANLYELQPGMTAKFLLNHRGEIFGIVGTNSYNVAYLAQSGIAAGIDANLQLKFITEKGKWEMYECADKVTLYKTVALNKVESKTFSRSEFADLKNILDAAMKFNGKTSGMLMGYVLGDEKIKEIYISDSLGSQTGYPGLDKKNFSLDYMVTGTGNSIRLYQGTLGARMFADGTTKVFFVPPDISGGVNEKEFKVGSTQLFSNPGDEYIENVRFYDVNEERLVGYIVVTSAADEKVSEEDNILVVKNITKAFYDEQEVYKINGMRGGVAYSIYTDADDVNPISTGKEGADNWATYGMKVSQLQGGDVIQFSQNSLGNLTDFRLLFRIGENYNEKWNKPDIVPPESKMALLHTGFGRVVEKAGVTLIVNCYGDGTNPTYDKAYRMINTNLFMCEYGKDGVRLSKIKAADISALDEVFIRNWWNGARDIVVYRNKH